MNSVLTSITGTFGKRMLLASLLPVLVTAVLLSLLYGEVTLATLGERFASLSTGDGILALTGITLSAFTLHTLNVPILRLFEGYPWQDTFPGRYFIERHQKRFERLDLRQRALRRVQGAFPEESNQRAQVTAIRERIRKDLASLPYESEWILPTRLGNVMRRAETYSQVQYSLDSIHLWPRLVQVIDSHYRAMIEESRISMDFCVHMSLLLALAGVVSLCAFFLQIGPLTFGTLGASLVLLAGARAMYLLSIGRADAWGQMIKSSIDLFRWDLLKQLGIEQKPDTMREERALWSEITRQLHFGDYVDTNLVATPRVDYVREPAARPKVVAKIGSKNVSVHKAFVDRRYNGIGVKLTVTNNDAKVDAQAVEIIDDVVGGYVYACDSESGAAAGVLVEAGGRIKFSIGSPITPGNSVAVGYRLLRLHA